MDNIISTYKVIKKCYLCRMEIRRINNGKIFYFGNDVIPKYSFNAKELDEETGMYYFEARYYRAPTFISRDPLMNEKPWLTPYHYCSNNPIGRVDPSGMSDDWYQDADGNVKWDENVSSQADLKQGERYIGKTAEWINDNGLHKGDKNGNLTTKDLNTIVSANKMNDHEKAMQVKQALHMHEFNNKELCFGMPWDMVGFQIGVDAYDQLGAGIDITFGYVKGEGGFLNIAPKFGIGKGESLVTSIVVGKYHGEGNPSSTTMSGPSSFISVGLSKFNYSYSRSGITSGWSTHSVGYNWISKTSSVSTGFSVTVPLLKFK